MFLCQRLPPGGSWRRRRLKESACSISLVPVGSRLEYLSRAPSVFCFANVKCPLTRTWANFISHRARRDISQCAAAHYFTFCGSKTFHYMHLCLQMQCLSRKKDEEFLQFFVLFLLVGVSFFHTALSQPPLGHHSFL